MTLSFHIDIEIDEAKHDDDVRGWIEDELNKQWIEKIVENSLENENVTADVHVMDVKPD